MSVFFAITILLLNICAMYIRVGINFYLDVFGNDGFIKAYVFGIRVFKAKIHFEHDSDNHNNLVIEQGKKSDKLHINSDTNDKKSIAALMKNPAFKMLLIEKVSAHFTAGKINDSFFTVALLQSMRVLFYSVMAPLKCRYSMNITESFTPVYNRNIFQVDFISIIGVSVADIIVSTVSNLFKRNSKVKLQEAAKI